MSTQVIRPLLLKSVPDTGTVSQLGSGDRTSLPLPDMVRPVPPRPLRWVYGLRRIDQNGRVMDKGVIGALGWEPRVRLDAALLEGAARLARGSGKCCITGDGNLRLAARLRTRLDLGTDAHVLLAADTCAEVLVVFPMHILDTVVGAWLGECHEYRP